MNYFSRTNIGVASLIMTNNIKQYIAKLSWCKSVVRRATATATQLLHSNRISNNTVSSKQPDACSHLSSVAENSHH